MNATTVVQPFAPRHTTVDTGHTLVITVPSRRRWLMIIPNGLFVVIWVALVLGFAVFGASVVIDTFLHHPATLVDDLLPAGFLIVWAVLFSVGGLTALYEVVWGLAGREMIEVSRTALRVARVIPGWTRRKEYAAQHIQALRVSPQLMPQWYGRRGWPRGNPGQMAFDYGARTIRFGDADEAEAKMILAEIQRRFPQYGGGDDAARA